MSVVIIYLFELRGNFQRLLGRIMAAAMEGLTPFQMGADQLELETKTCCSSVEAFSDSGRL